MSRILALGAVVLLGACTIKDSDEPASAASSAAGDAAAAVASTAPVDPPGKPVDVEDKNPLYHFGYAYPAEAGGISALKAQLDAELDEARSSIASDAREGRDAAKQNGFGFTPYDRTIEWSVVADIPGWLSLLGSTYEFSGGAHGNSGTSPLLWDKAAGRRRAPLALFLSKEAFNTALRDAYCAALDKERFKRREEPVRRDPTDPFSACLNPGDVTVLLGSADKAHFTRIGLIADPYVAGPYVEGSYEITLPVSRALIAAVRPEYRQFFAPGR